MPNAIAHLCVRVGVCVVCLPLIAFVAVAELFACFILAKLIGV